MYKYNLFCYIACMIGALVAYFILRDIPNTILSVVLGMVNYMLYYNGKQEEQSQKHVN